MEAQSAEIPYFVEIHRGRATQDLHRTIEYVKAVPDLMICLSVPPASMHGFPMENRLTLDPVESIRWWEQGMAYWLKEAHQDHVLPFVTELPDYAITTPLNFRATIRKSLIGGNRHWC